jgi:hypothetical protein
MGDEILLFHEGKQEYFRLNPTGAAIWRMFSEPHTIEDVVGRLRDEFVVEAERCGDEVSRFVASLVANCFLVAA